MVGLDGSVFTVCHRQSAAKQARLPVAKSSKRLIQHMKYDDVLGSFVITKGMSKNLIKVVVQLDYENLVNLQGRLNIQSQKILPSQKYQNMP